MFLIDIGKFLLNIIYFFIKLFPTKKKITFISRQSNNLPLDYELILEKLKHVNVKIITKKLDHNLKSYFSNFILLFKQMYHLATSKVVITDGYSIPVSILKHKKTLTIIQLWHANGIIKKIGLQTLDSRNTKEKKLSLKMNMHKNYDYAISSSKETTEVYKEAFGLKNGQVLEFGTPTLDYIYNKKYLQFKDEIKEKYNLGNKKNIIYMPTYRKNRVIDINKMIKKINFNKYNLLVKLHPVNKPENFDARVINIKGYTSEELLAVADYVITDYSNVAFEAALANIPVYFYVYDIDKYKKNPGLNIDLINEIPKYSKRNIEKIIDLLYNYKYDFKELQRFTNKYIEVYDGKCTERIIEFIKKCIGEV